MAGRCGCSSSNATGASISAGSCVTVSGAGTTASPAVIGVEIDPSDANNLQCGSAGLFVSGAQLEAGDDSIGVTGDGSDATPYELTVAISADSANRLTLEADGLQVLADPSYDADTTGYAGGVAPATDWYHKVGQTVILTDVNGFATINFGTAFPNGIITVVPAIGDLVTSAGVELCVDAANVTAAGFRVRLRDGTGTPLAGSNVRIVYTAWGW